MSNERGDKLKFADFQLLLESLLSVAVKASTLVTGVEWDFEFSTGTSQGDRFLNGDGGTPDLLARLERHPNVIETDDLEDTKSAVALRHAKEAVLALRNMSLMEENAQFMSEEPALWDCLTLLLRLPRGGRFNELINDALDITERVGPYWHSAPDDHLMLSLLEMLRSNDRYHIVTSLKAITLYSTRLEEPKSLSNIPQSIIETLMQYIYLDQDNDLISGTLDFLYQFTVHPDNIMFLIEHFKINLTLAPRLVNLLVYDADREDLVKVDQEERREPPRSRIPEAPASLVQQLLKFNEPERTARWLKCCFTEDEECEITQLTLWQAYQECFANNSHGLDVGPTMSASDFINTVSRTFDPAQAQVVHGPQPKFIIRGIRPLETVYNLNGYPFHACQWTVAGGTKCSMMFLDPSELRHHVFADHMRLQPKDKAWNLEDSEYRDKYCFWGDCNAYLSPIDKTALVYGHVSAHLPPRRDMSRPPPIPRRRVIQPRVARRFDFYATPVDENGEAYGVAYKALLILRNILRNLPQGLANSGYKGSSWTDVVFMNRKRTLLEMADYNKTLRADIFELVRDIDRK